VEPVRPGCVIAAPRPRHGQIHIHLGRLFRLDAYERRQSAQPELAIVAEAQGASVTCRSGQPGSGRGVERRPCLVLAGLEGKSRVRAEGVARPRSGRHEIRERNANPRPRRAVGLQVHVILHLPLQVIVDLVPGGVAPDQAEEVAPAVSKGPREAGGFDRRLDGRLTGVHDQVALRRGVHQSQQGLLRRRRPEETVQDGLGDEAGTDRLRIREISEVPGLGDERDQRCRGQRGVEPRHRHRARGLEHPRQRCEVHEDRAVDTTTRHGLVEVLDERPGQRSVWRHVEVQPESGSAERVVQARVLRRR
jgi:hypothetical protein